MFSRFHQRVDKSEARRVHFQHTFEAAEVLELQISWMQNWSRLQERGEGSTSVSTLSICLSTISVHGSRLQVLELHGAPAENHVAIKAPSDVDGAGPYRLINKLYKVHEAYS